MPRATKPATPTAAASTPMRAAKRIPASVLGSQLLADQKPLLDVLIGDFEVTSPDFYPVLPGTGVPRRCLDEVEVIQPLTASPGTVKPFENIDLQWSVNVPAGACEAMPFRLAHRYVSPSGSLQVPAEGSGTNVFALIAYASGKSKILGQVTVQVDASECFMVNIPGSMIEDLLDRVVEEIDAEDDLDFSLRKAPLIEVTEEGIRLKLYTSIDTPWYAPTAKVDFDARFGLVAMDGEVFPLYQSFKYSLIGAWKIVPKAFFAGLVEVVVKPKILAEIRQAINDEIENYAPSGSLVLAVEHAQDEIRLTVCPGPA
jgi:hypothetical protein